MTISRRERPVEWHREVRAFLKWGGLSALSWAAALVMFGLAVAKHWPICGWIGLALFIACFPLSGNAYRHVLHASRIERKARRNKITSG